jgi:hypothetical protein
MTPRAARSQSRPQTISVQEAEKKGKGKLCSPFSFWHGRPRIGSSYAGAGGRRTHARARTVYLPRPQHVLVVSAARSENKLPLHAALTSAGKLKAVTRGEPSPEGEMVTHPCSDGDDGKRPGGGKGPPWSPRSRCRSRDHAHTQAGSQRRPKILASSPMRKRDPPPPIMRDLSPMRPSTPPAPTVRTAADARGFAPRNRV